MHSRVPNNFFAMLSAANSAIQQAGYTLQRNDRTSDTGRSRGCVLCVYKNNSLCKNTVFFSYR